MYSQIVIFAASIILTGFISYMNYVELSLGWISGTVILGAGLPFILRQIKQRFCQRNREQAAEGG